ncbi:hypothetical protein E2320_022374, partial [Naja naja]
KYLSYGKETLQRTGEHLGPGWTFLLYGGFLAHIRPLGVPGLQPACPEENPSLPPSTSPGCGNSGGSELILGVPFLQSPRSVVRGKTEVEDGMETSAAWMASTPGRSMPPGEGREVWKEETFNGSLAPKRMGPTTPGSASRSTPKRGRYRCHVEHDGLQEPLDLALEEPTNSKSNLGLIISCVVAALVLALVIFVVLVVMKPRIMEFLNVKTTEQQQVSDLSSLHVISNLEQGPEAPSLEVYVCVCVCVCYLPLHAKNQAVEDGPPFHYSQAVLGSGVLKEKLLGQGNPEEHEKTRLVEGPSD